MYINIKIEIILILDNKKFYTIKRKYYDIRIKIIRQWIKFIKNSKIWIMKMHKYDQLHYLILINIKFNVISIK